MKKEKGFTLVELLAVIVILAVLVLLAVPSVIKMLDNTKKNAFAVEAENIIKAGKNAYASEMLDGTFENGCYSLEKLSQYTDKNFDGYTGSVYIDSENNNDKVWLGNGDYIIAGSYSGNMVVTKLTSERPAPNNCDDMFVVTDPSGEGETATTVQELLDRIDALETRMNNVEQAWSNAGTIYSTDTITNASTLTGNTDTTACQLMLSSPGTYLLYGSVEGAAWGTNVTTSCIFEGSGRDHYHTAESVYSHKYCNASSYVVVGSTAKTIGFQVYQNSGSTKTISACSITAVRIK